MRHSFSPRIAGAMAVAAMTVSLSTRAEVGGGPETPQVPASLAQAEAPEPAASDPVVLATVEALAGVVATGVSVPVTLALASGLGSLGNSVLVTGVPALLIMAFLPPVVVSASMWGMERWLGHGDGSFWATLGVTTLGHVAVIASAILLRGDARDPNDVMTLTAVEAALLPAAGVGMLWLTRGAPLDEEGAP